MWNDCWAIPASVRHRGKIEATIRGARLFLAAGGADAFCDRCWAWVDDRPLQPAPVTMADLPARTALSARVAAELRAEGYGFLGPTSVHAWMQAVGLVNEHMTDCPRHAAVRAMG